LLIFASLFGFIGAFISLALSKSSAKKAYKITPIQAEQVGSLSVKERLVWDTVENLSQRNNIKMPEVGIYQSSDANAFATGASKNNSLVAVSSGLLDAMSPKAIE
jgi:heat shock protein HtpX